MIIKCNKFAGERVFRIVSWNSICLFIYSVIAISRISIAAPATTAFTLPKHLSLFVINCAIEKYDVEVDVNGKPYASFASEEYRMEGPARESPLTEGDNRIRIIMSPKSHSRNGQASGEIELLLGTTSLFKTKVHENVDEANIHVQLVGGKVGMVSIAEKRWADAGRTKLIYQVMAAGDARTDELGSIKESVWSENGKPLLEVTEDKGCILYSKDYKPDGTVGAEVKDGNGYRRRFYATGTVEMEMPIQNGLAQGMKKEYDASGVLRISAQFDKGLLEGEYNEFNQAGVLWVKGTFRQGKMEGVWTRYEASGKEAARSTFEKGKLIKGKDEFRDIDVEFN